MLGKVAEVIQHFGEGLGGGGLTQKPHLLWKGLIWVIQNFFLSNNLQRPLKI